MAADPTSTDGQGWISAAASGSAGDTITVKDSSGNTIAEFTATKDFGLIQFSSSKITNGESYTVSVNGTDTSVTAGEATQSTMGPGGMGGGMGMPGQQGSTSGTSDSGTSASTGA